MLDSFARKSLPFSELRVVCLTPLHMFACTIFLTGKDIHVYTHMYIHIYENIYTDIDEHKHIYIDTCLYILFL